MVWVFSKNTKRVLGFNCWSFVMDFIFSVIKWFFIISILLIVGGVVIYYIMEQNRKFYTCDECGEEDAMVRGETVEVDRYSAYKEVTETTASGKSRTRHIKVLKVKEKTYYRCKFCGASFITTNTRELD